MAPDLVIATSAFTSYPGGVIAVRAADWIAPGSSASSEANALASTGVVVRETQQVTPTTPPFLDGDAYDSAVDTLLIPLADIGTESDATYDVYITLFVEGEWDVTNEPLLRLCTNLHFQDVVGYGLHGDLFATESDPNWDNFVLCRIPHFQSVFLRAFNTEPTDTLHFRFYSQDGTTAEVLIDQLVFVPRSVGSEWDFNVDLRTVGITTTTNITDGADGGDANGKFTVYRPTDVDESMRSSQGSSDFQRVADGDDAEYHQRVTEVHNNVLRNSVTLEEANAHGYGLYCARSRGPIIYSEDTFDNRSTSTTGRDMGIDEAGYGYAIGGSSDSYAYVDSGVGVITLNFHLRSVNTRWGDSSQGSAGIQNQGAELNAFGDQLTFSGFIEHIAGTDASTSGGVLRLQCGRFLFNGWDIQLNTKTHIWDLYYFDGSTSFLIGVNGPHDISSWWPANEMGFKFEVKRYVLRVRLWDASGAEPSTWDEEIFVPARGETVPPTAYDYSDNLGKARLAYNKYDVFGFDLRSTPNTGMTFPFSIQINSLQFEHDPYGDPADMYARMERPDGSSLGDITIPWGCPYFVYWGLRDWTDVDVLPEIEFAERIWNDTSAAEIQRAETLLWWFRVTHGGIISMNWREADRTSGANRVLVGP